MSVTPLARLLEKTQAVGRPVAFGRAGERDLGDFQRDVARLAARLEAAAAGRVLLHCEDAYAFAVGLFAAGRVGARAVLPPSGQAGALRRLALEVAVALLDAVDAPDTIEGRPCWHPLAAGAEGAATPAEGGCFDRDAPWVELFTSGTTGHGRPVRKAVRHLEDEVRVLEDRLGPELGSGTRLLATVSPQHLYGLLFRVLWPLAAGRPFLRSPVLHPEELLPHAGDAGSPFALVTTPVSLRRLVEMQSAAALRGCRAVFSSGGPLGAELARRAAAALGTAPWEIYGSTETGGVAVRRQIRGDEPWQTLPGVDVERDPEQGCLAVISPFVSAGESRGGGQRFVLGDRVELGRSADEGFRLLGRADRVVKIGEKRLSLPAMEARLAAHPAVDEAALLVLEASGESRVGAVVVPTEEGRRLVAATGRRGLAKVLGEHLAPDFDRVLLPRAWRVADTLPRDAQGKLPTGPLRALFEPNDLRPSASRRPEVLALRREGRVLEARLRIPESFDFLEGHFPSRPVVAGVVQLHVAMHALGELLGAAPRLRSLTALKFREPLLPGQEVRLRVELGAARDGFGFQLADADAPARIFSSGRGRLEREA